MDISEEYIQRIKALEDDVSALKHIVKRLETRLAGPADQQVLQYDKYDELLPAAVKAVLETGQASASMLQRRLKLGYARAARLIDQLEEKGVVGPFEGSAPRKILITKEQWTKMQ